MRLMFFVHRYWPSVGGVEKYVHELAKALIHLNHEVLVVAGAHVDGLAESDEHEGVPILRFPAHRSPLRCRAWFWLRRSLFARFDVIQVSNTHVLEYFTRMLGPFLDRSRVFLTRHGMSYTHPVPENEKIRAQRSLTMAAGFVHDGAFIEKWLGVKPDLCPDQGLAPVADAIELTPEPPPDSAIFIGRIEPDSGIRLYLDGLRKLVHDHSVPFTLNVYGDGTLMPQLRKQVAQDELSVHFFGKVPDAQRFITNSCFAFIDGRMAIQEAMARRRLVFAAYVDPLKRDYVGSERFSPFLIPIGNADELAQKVAHYVEHPSARAALVGQAYSHARTLSWAKTAREFLRFWAERMADPGAQSEPQSLIRILLPSGHREQAVCANECRRPVESRS